MKSSCFLFLVFLYPRGRKWITKLLNRLLLQTLKEANAINAIHYRNYAHSHGRNINVSSKRMKYTSKIRPYRGGHKIDSSSVPINFKKKVYRNNIGENNSAHRFGSIHFYRRTKRNGDITLLKCMEALLQWDTWCAGRRVTELQQNYCMSRLPLRSPQCSFLAHCDSQNDERDCKFPHYARNF